MTTQSKPAFESVVDTLARALGGSIGWLAEHGVLFVFFMGLWAIELTAIALKPALVHDAWTWFGSLNIVVQLVTWLLLLPVIGGVWAWETAWPDLVRIAVVLGLAAFTFLVMKPKGWFGGTAV